MKTLIAYYSYTGNNEVLARDLQKKLNGDLFKIEPKQPRTYFSIMMDIIFNRTPEITDFYHAHFTYDHHVLIGPVWAGRIGSPLRSFLQKEGAGIANYSFITICGGVSGQNEKITRSLTKIAGRMPSQVVELRLNELLLGTGRKSLQVDNYKLEPGDLRFFEPRIDNFVKSIQRDALVKI